MPDLKKFILDPNGYDDFGNKFPFINNETEIVEDSATNHFQASLFDA